MTRAVVLGGGGPVGIGWEAGLIVGLRQAGIDLALADAIVGTSAGSVVGFTLASGGDMTQAVGVAGGAAGESGPAGAVGASGAGGPDGAAGSGPAGEVPGATAQGAGPIEQLMSTVARAASEPEGAEDLRAQLGQIALAAATISDEQWLAMFAAFAGAPWPAGFACTAVNATTGGFQIWDDASGVDPQLAIASSCAVPGVFPTVSIGGGRYMDGGVRDILNADVASGHDNVLAVSCTMLEIPEGLAGPTMDAVFAATRAQLDCLRDAGSKVDVIVPGAEMLEISGWGAHLMDFTRAAAAFEAGRRQGEMEAGRLAGFWAG